MKKLLTFFAFCLAACIAPSYAEENMPKNSGDIFGAGIRILMDGPNQPLQGSGEPVAYLHFVDNLGNTIKPTYEPDGLQTPAGPLAGAKYVLASPASVAALLDRVEALEAKEMVPVEVFGQTSVAANANEIIFVNFDDGIGPSDITINLPAPTAELTNARIRITDISADGGLSAGQALKLAGTFAPAVGGGYITSPYVVGDNGAGLSRRGAWVDVVCLGAAGWRISAEGVQPMAPL